MCRATNQNIRSAAKSAGVFFWEIAEKLGMQDSAFSRKLRRELPEAEKTRVLDIIEEIAKGRC